MTKKFMLIVIVIYFATHLFALSKLPVFGDEAIYIRWSQLIIDDAPQYAFFPLNDGKTPLQMWLMVPLLNIFRDQLFAGRLLSVFVGFFQVIVMFFLAKTLGFAKKTQYLVAILTIFLPFWFFHHRMALIDGLLTLWLSLSWWQTILAMQTKHWKYVAFAGLFFGLSILSKTTAVLWLPVIGITGLYYWQFEKSLKISFKDLVIKIGIICFTGLAIFSLLIFAPSFSQLFNRGSDFLYSGSEITIQLIIRNFFINGGYFLYIFATYLSWPLVLLALILPFLPQKKNKSLFILACAIFFILPIMLVGKIIFARYLLPASIFITLSGSLAIEYLYELLQKKQLLAKAIFSIIFVLLCAKIVDNAARFTFFSYTNTDEIPFTEADFFQYLGEWSSGHGIKEATQYFIDESTDKKILVLTEGYFGSLPDGILMYMHDKIYPNLKVEGIGQPVNNIAPEWREKAVSYDDIYLVVNSHRLFLTLDKKDLILEKCRPKNMPCFQVWNIKPFLDSSN